MSTHTKEIASISKSPLEGLRIYYRLHIFWLLTITLIFLGQAWWLIPLPGDFILSPYRTYPAALIKGAFESAAVFLAARSLVVALIKVFSRRIYPDSVVKFRSTGGMETIYSGLRYRAGLRYLIIASVLPAAFFIGNLLQAEFQSSATIFYSTQATESNMNAAQCQHTSQNHYHLASSAVDKGLVTNSLKDASSMMKILHDPSTSNFGVSFISAEFNPVADISIQSHDQKSIAKRNHGNKCKNKNYGKSTSTTNQITTTQSDVGAVGIAATQTVSINGQVNLGDGTVVPTDGRVSNSPTENLPTPVTSQPIYGTSDSNLSTAVAGEITNTTRILIDGHAINNMTGQIQHIESLPPITTNTTNGTAVDLYVFRYTSPHDREAIIIVSNPPEHYQSGFYVSARTFNYTCFSGSTLYCSQDHNTTDTNYKEIADALAEAMRSNTELYGTSGLITDVLDNKYENDTQLADALFANPLCSDLAVYPVTGHMLNSYTRATWSPLAIIWAVLLILVWAIGAYLIGSTLGVFCNLTQWGFLIPQIINNSDIFEDEEDGKLLNQAMYLELKKIELIPNNPLESKSSETFQ